MDGVVTLAGVAGPGAGVAELGAGVAGLGEAGVVGLGVETLGGGVAVLGEVGKSAGTLVWSTDVMGVESWNFGPTWNGINFRRNFLFLNVARPDPSTLMTY